MNHEQYKSKEQNNSCGGGSVVECNSVTETVSRSTGGDVVHMTLTVMLATKGVVVTDDWRAVYGVRVKCLVHISENPANMLAVLFVLPIRQ